MCVCVMCIYTNTYLARMIKKWPNEKEEKKIKQNHEIITYNKTSDECQSIEVDNASSWI